MQNSPIRIACGAAVVFFSPLYVLQLQAIARNYSQASQQKSISSQQSVNTSDAQNAANKYE